VYSDRENGLERRRLLVVGWLVDLIPMPVFAVNSCARHEYSPVTSIIRIRKRKTNLLALKTAPILLPNPLPQLSIIHLRQTMIIRIHLIQFLHRCVQRFFTHKSQRLVVFSCNTVSFTEILWDVSMKGVIDGFGEENETIFVERYCQGFVWVVVREAV